MSAQKRKFCIVCVRLDYRKDGRIFVHVDDVPGHAVGSVEVSSFEGGLAIVDKILTAQRSEAKRLVEAIVFAGRVP